MSRIEAAVRRTGALVALAGASGLVVVVAPPVVGSNAAVLALYAIYLLGCAAELLSPAHRAVADLARRAAAQTTRKLHSASARANTVLRWAGFAYIVFCAAAADVCAAEEANGLLLFLLFLLGVWTVSLSMRAANHPPLPPPPPAAEEGHDGVEINSTVPRASRT